MSPTPPYQEPPITPPGSSTQVVNGGSNIANIPLTTAEQAIFIRDLARLGARYSLESPLYQLLMDDAGALMAVAAMAKGSIGTNPTFNGAEASGNEIGMQLVRAPSVLSNNTQNNPTQTAPVYSWVQTYIAAGWTNVFGSSSSFVDLSSTGISGYQVTNTNNRVLMAFIALLDPVSSPQLQEIRFHIEQVDYAVQPCAWLAASDLYYTKLDAVYMVPANGRFYMRGNVQPSTTGGIDQTELFGLTFSTGNYLSYE